MVGAVGLAVASMLLFWMKTSRSLSGTCSSKRLRVLVGIEIGRVPVAEEVPYDDDSRRHCYDAHSKAHDGC